MWGINQGRIVVLWQCQACTQVRLSIEDVLRVNQGRTHALAPFAVDNLASKRIVRNANFLRLESRNASDAVVSSPSSNLR